MSSDLASKASSRAEEIKKRARTTTQYAALAGSKTCAKICSALPACITVAAGITCYGLFYKRGIWLSVIAYSLSPAERVLNGEVAYRDFLFNYTPGVLWLNALLMKFFGATLMTIRVGLFGFKLATLIALFYVGRKLIGGWAALIPVALTLAWLGHRFLFCVHPTQYSMLLALLGLACLIKYNESGKARLLVLCGLAIGAVFIFKYNVGLLLAASVTAIVASRELMLASDSTTLANRLSKVATAVIFCWLGFAAVAAALAAYMLHNHALGAMLDHFLHHAAEYSEQRSVGLPSIKLVMPFAIAQLALVAGGWVVLSRATRFFEAYLILATALSSMSLLFPGRMHVLKESATASVHYFPLAVFTLALSIILQLSRSQNRQLWWQRNWPLVIVALFALGIYLEVFPRADYYHLVRVLPPMFLLLVVIAVQIRPALQNYLSGHIARPERAAFACMAAPLVLLLVIGIKDTWQPQFDSSFRFIDRVPLSIERARGIAVSERDAEFIASLFVTITDNSRPDDYIFSFARRGGGFYFLAGRRNPTRLLWWDSVGISKQEREAALAVVAEKQPKLILIQDNLRDERIRRLIEQNYHLIAKAADIAVYDRNQ
jgi:4-amino-4-deoxy-L-arabinose transferase-like glycosyltransferase